MRSKVQEFVANGDMGRVVHVDKGKMHVQLRYPNRLVYIAGKSLGDFSLAYAITVHKSQGSQWPIVIYVSDDSGFRWVSRELIYTALSRAETLAITIGSKGTILQDCEREVLSKRKTLLVEKLSDAKP